ncbi:hypothetical protein ACT5E2_09305 [Limosilactobacillus mucosae]|uniref:hypothetical protein n=1 Tax=Limosilactobacillus mucosae TaxID=97478 RepID=UPI00403942A5
MKASDNENNHKSEQEKLLDQFVLTLDDKQLMQFKRISSMWNEALERQEKELSELEKENERLLSLLEAFNKQLADQLP